LLAQFAIAEQGKNIPEQNQDHKQNHKDRTDTADRNDPFSNTV
jgi:hypothetical protein